MGDITSVNTISLLRVLQKKTDWKRESFPDVGKHIPKMFAHFCRLAAGLTGSGGWTDLGIRSLGSSLVPDTKSLDDHELDPHLLGGLSLLLCRLKRLTF